MSKIKISISAFALFVGIASALAANGNFSPLETKEFYINNDFSSTGIEYATEGQCTPSEVNYCHATFTRPNSSSPWVRTSGTEVKGNKPF